jgi:D-3-phosphoglycerate dehydrogenase
MIDKIIANFPKDKDFKVFKSLSEIFDWADIISLHIPGGGENKNLINYKLLKKIFGIVNMSRPCIVNEQDLIKVLEENPKFFYVSDVVYGEPNVEKINKKLLSFDNVFIYPHIGANTIQVQQDIFRQFEEWVRGINECFK